MDTIDYSTDMSALDTYKMIDVDANIFETEVEGKPTTMLGMQFGNGLHLLEEFVMEAINTAQPAFVLTERQARRNEIKIGNAVLEQRPLARYFTQFNRFKNDVMSDLTYSAHVELFRQCYTALGLEMVRFTTPRAESLFPGKLHFEIFNDVVMWIGNAGRKPEFKRLVDAREYNSIRNNKSAVTYVNGLFDRFSRIEVIRIDFGYRHQIAHTITVENAKADIEHFLNNRRGNKRIFAACVGYILKIEDGPEKGIHFHSVFFYDGAKVFKDGYIALQISQYWQELTEGRGTYYNCNASKNKYKRLGIGTISHNDEVKRSNLLLAIKYLCKKEQYLRSTKLGSACRVFSKGVLPRDKSSAGRPRKMAAFRRVSNEGEQNAK
jgi:hypothetical protein